MNALRLLLAVLIAVVLVPAFYVFFNASIRNPAVALVVTIPFIIHAIVRSFRMVRVWHTVLAWVTATAWVGYGFWEQHVKSVHPDWNIRIDLFPIFAVLYIVTFACIWFLLFPTNSTMRSAHKPKSTSGT
ncbi:MAG: hypothetical protein ABIK07_12210 [Planctomycetota bacterium]|uniref:hypothetical protein n=1 Tax=uncultured Gimesia sp. TaxID=1678688 RepID=UPI00262DFBFB|nr:hypothetical protein [uncultured Gimesia sp.]